MTESDVIRESVDGPVVHDRLVGDLTRLGIEPGMTLLVHCSLSSIWWVVGGPVTVIRALLECIGPQGTLVMPTHSGDLSDPSEWVNPPVDPGWWPTIRQNMPAFDRDLTPTRGMGVVAECFRRAKGCLRSGHPQFSFAAFGPKAEFITNKHALESSFGEQSPLAKIYDLEGRILLLGVSHESNTSLHLAETRASYGTKRFISHGTPISINGVTQWTQFNDLDPKADDFIQLGQAYEASHMYSRGSIGAATSILLPQRELTDFAVDWLESHR